MLRRVRALLTVVPSPLQGCFELPQTHNLGLRKFDVALAGVLVWSSARLHSVDGSDRRIGGGSTEEYRAYEVKGIECGVRSAEARLTAQGLL
jgi:hypothetical protein